MGNHFTVAIPAKIYIKAYLISNCGDPVDLRHLPALYNEFQNMLVKSPRDPLVATNGSKPEFVKIIIPPDLFYRNGYELSYDSCIKLHAIAESSLKFFSRQYIALNHSIGIPVADCIREFQDKFGYNETIWNYESIKKDFDRHGFKTELKYLRALQREISCNLLNDLKESGIITDSLIKYSAMECRERY